MNEPPSRTCLSHCGEWTLVDHMPRAGTSALKLIAASVSNEGIDWEIKCARDLPAGRQPGRHIGAI
jgi:hypothetical protein